MKDGYKFGKKVLFVDDGGNQIEGIIRDREEYEDRTVLVIELSEGGWYRASLRKKEIQNGKMLDAS